MESRKKRDPSLPKRKYTRKVKVLTDIKVKSPAPAPTPKLEGEIEDEKEKYNEKYIELMDTLAYIMRRRNDAMRALAYKNARATIATFPGDITDPNQLKDKPGIGSTIYSKLVEYTSTGTLKVLEESKDILENRTTMEMFTNIHGVGEKKAEELIRAGILTMAELEKRKEEVLNPTQLIGLRYYDDILKRIPRAEIEKYEEVFKDAFPKNIECSRFEIVGSYRRGTADSGDIDLIITSSYASLFKMFVDALIERKIIVEVLSRGNAKCLVVAKLPGAHYARRVDFLYCTPEEYPFSVLYFTGSAEFNTVMREYALSLKYTLNEHGLSVMENKKKGELVNHLFMDEKSIFDFLGLAYKKPNERIGGSAVVKTDGTPVVPEPKLKTHSPDAKVPTPEPKIKSPSPKKVPTPTKVPEPTTIKIKVKRTTKKKHKEEDVDRNKDMASNIETFKKDGIKVLETMSEANLASMVEYAHDAFHGDGEPVMSDNQYDIIYEFMKAKYPNNAYFKKVGAKVKVDKNKVALPYKMASMDKIKPDTGSLPKWQAKYAGPYVLSCKLDGISGMYSTEGDVPKLYTRGDGDVGQDISYLIPHLRLPKDKGVVIRGEFIMSKEIFKTKYKAEFSNPRNLVASVTNQKTQDDKVNDVRFIAYEVIKPAGLKPSEQMSKLATLDVDVVQNMVVPSLTNDELSKTLIDWRANHPYEIDGVIVSDDKVYPRATGNPDHSFAFKMVLSDQMAESHVVDVIWTPSKDGLLKPRIRIMPVTIGGVVIEYATGNNARSIQQKGIGIGAIVQVIRSGDVIPKIEQVTVPAEHPKMPDVDYEWANEVDIRLKDSSSDVTVLEKNITGFFVGLDVVGLGPGSVKKMVSSGFDSVPKILRMTKDDFLKVDGFKDKTATKLVEGIREAVAKASLITIMASSNKLGAGFGTKRAELIVQHYPNVFAEGERNRDKLIAIKGLGKDSVDPFIEHIPEFLQFMKDCGLESKLTLSSEKPIEKPSVNTNHPLYDKAILMTGFRDKSIEEKIASVGARIASGVNKKTFILLVADKDATNTKVEEAKRLNIRIMTPAEFTGEYF
jgi:DNA ligase (NAD+)